jgi:DNA mismatch endonuclease (patch repair protein)
VKLTGRIGKRLRRSTDCYTTAERSYVMSRIRSQGNRTTELRFLRFCRRYGIKGWKRGSKLFGRPDFWHGNPKTHRPPKSNVEYWTKKILTNKRRDRLVNRTLKGQGWRVFRVWESDLRSDIEAVMAKLRLLI